MIHYGNRLSGSREHLHVHTHLQYTQGRTRTNQFNFDDGGIWNLWTNNLIGLLIYLGIFYFTYVILNIVGYNQDLHILFLINQTTVYNFFFNIYVAIFLRI